MKKIVSLILILSLSLSVFSQTSVIKYHGIVNEDSVRVRETIGLTGNIVGKLNRGDSVLILGRSQERTYLDGFDSYWLKIATAAFEGWLYGAYVNLTDAQYSALPITSREKISSVPDLNYSRQLPTDAFLAKERETLKQQGGQFSSQTVELCYDNIVEAFNRQQSLRPFFLNTIDTLIYETNLNFLVSSSIVCEYIQSSYIDNIQISKLYIGNDNSGVFWISGFKKSAEFTGIQIEVMAFNILKVEKTDSLFLERKVLIDDMSFSPLTLIDFNNSIELYESFFSTSSPYFYGPSLLLQMLTETMEINGDIPWVK